MWRRWCNFIAISIVCFCYAVLARPSVDPGLFMILGVETCRDGEGYCFLGVDCTLDDDFSPDDRNGHCNGLKNAFTPSAHFTCCMYNTSRDEVTTTRRPRPGQQKPSTTTIAPTSLSSVESSTANLTVNGTKPTSISLTNSTPLPTAETLLTTTEAVGYGTTNFLELGTEPANQVFVDVSNDVLHEVLPPSLGSNATEVQVV